MTSEANALPLAEPLAYFLTWTTYGTWLPGDERGWVRRRGVFEQHAPGLVQYSQSKQIGLACVLSPTLRRIVEETIVAHCKVRGWRLWIVRSLSNHVHAVVTAPGYDPDTLMEQFKAWCTRKLKAVDDGQRRRMRWWTERGSTRFINDEAGLESAIVYVRDCQ